MDTKIVQSRFIRIHVVVELITGWARNVTRRAGGRQQQPISSVPSHGIYDTVSWMTLIFYCFQEFDSSGVSSGEGGTMLPPGREEQDGAGGDHPEETGGGKENNPGSTNAASPDGNPGGKKTSGKGSRDGGKSRNASSRSSTRPGGRARGAKTAANKVGYSGVYLLKDNPLYQ